jgi:hypothetical protein
VDYSRITPEIGMAMKKASSDDSPLREGAEKSFWTLRTRVDNGGGLQYFSWIDIQALRVFLMK